MASLRSLAYGAFGYTAAKSTDGSYFSVADDFKLNETTVLTGLAFYILQSSSTGAHPAPPTDGFAVIYDNDPSLGGSAIWGDRSQNVLYSVEPQNLYHVYESDLLNQDYPMSIVYLRINITLEPGTYWVEFFTGTTMSLSTYVPMTFAYQTPNILNFNAPQDRTYFGGSWVTISSPGGSSFEPSALIFDLYGNTIPTTRDSIAARLYIPVLLVVLIGGFFVLWMVGRAKRAGNRKITQ